MLDPAQNNSFRDHYLEVPFDLSRTLFIATANQLGTLHPALLDRMEVIQLAGYSEEEKLHIARRYLIPRQLGEHGLSSSSVELTDAALRRVISEYTREAGVRNLERQIGAIARKVAARVASRAPEDGGLPADTSMRDDVPEYLGPPRFHQEVVVPHVAARRRDRRGLDRDRRRRAVHRSRRCCRAAAQQIILTGQLGNVMQESARAAVSHIRAQASALGVSPRFLDKHDLHVHVPAGAIPKDGPRPA